MRELSNVTDYFIITSALNRRHIRALCDEIAAFGKENGIGAVGSEGVDQGDWALIDFSVFIVHIFRPEAREFYDLELIWGDAPLIDWKEHGAD